MGLSDFFFLLFGRGFGNDGVGVGLTLFAPSLDILGRN